MEDIWDEIGVPYLYTAWNCNVISWGSLNSRGLWETWRNYLLNTVWDNGSRGGVVGWDLSCETFYVLYTAGKEGQEKDFELLYSGAKLIRNKTWPDWFCMGDGDGSYNGRLSLASYHYWNQYSFGGKAGEGGFTYEPDGIMNYPPDTFFLNGAANVPRQKTLMHMSPDWLYGSCACGSTEDFEFFGPQNGVPHSRFIGDRAAISGACTANEPRGMAWTKLSLEGDRDTDEAIAGCVYWNSFYTAVNPRVSFCMPQQEIRYYSGAKFDRRIDLFDDEYKPGELEFRWGLVDPAGRTVRNGHIDAPSDTGFIERDRVTFDLPEVYQRTRFTLNMALWKDGVKRAHEERVVDVWPALSAVEGPALPEPDVAAGQPITVFDPHGLLTPIFKNLGVAAAPISALDADSLKGAKALVIGPDCLTKSPDQTRQVLRDFARAGRRVLVLHQNDASLLPMDAPVEQKCWRSIGFVRAGDHPVMRGLRDVDFEMWNPGHVIAKGAFHTPEKGAFLTLVDSAHDEGAGWRR